MEACYVCGSVNFSKNSGYYVCNDCDTQSQEIQEQSFEFSADSHVADDEERIEEVFEKEEVLSGHKLMSWEYYNLILKGLVDELLILGAQPKLKSMAFQLWASYLRTEGIAFISKFTEANPSFPTTFKDRDIEILHGIKSFRRMYFKGMRNVRKKTPVQKKENVNSHDSASECSMRNLRIKQRRVAVSALSDRCSLDAVSEVGSHSMLDGVNDGDSNTVISRSETLDQLHENSFHREKRVKISLSKKAHKSMEEILSQYEKTELEYDGDIPTSKKIWYSNRLYKRKRKESDTRLPSLCINTLLIILHICLLLNEDDIQLSDLLRWSYEGRISLYRPTRFIVDQYNMAHVKFYPCSRNNLLMEARNVTALLKVNNIPTPDLFKLVQRFAYELCLPDEFTEFVQRLMAIFPPQMDFNFYQHRIFPDYESRAMAYILYACKLLFSLDDATELCQSDFTDVVNQRIADMKMEHVPVFFSWSSWVQYIECRKTVLTNYDASINQLADGEWEIKDNAVLNYWRTMKSKIKSAPSTSKINPVLKSQIEEYVTNIQEKCPKHRSYSREIVFPNSTTPFRTYTEYLLTEHSESIPERTKTILSRNFNCSSIKYLLDKKWVNQIKDDLGLADVESVFHVPNAGSKLYEEPESNLPKISKTQTVPAHLPVAVEIVELEESGANTEVEDCALFEPEIEIFDLEPVDERKQKLEFQLRYPSSNYWFFHPIGRRLKSEKFCGMAEENFSHSFLWLLKECASILRAEIKDLYLELMNVEIALCSLFSDETYAQRAPLVVYPNEW